MTIGRRAATGSIALAASMLVLAAPAFAEGDAMAGKAVFRKCAACHSVEPGNRIGPSLSGLLGRPVASVEDFRYSEAMRAFADGGRVWDEALLSEYLLAPRAIVKGTAMAFVGLRRPKEIADVIAFLRDPSAAN